jgi:hypothetical protein
MKVKTRKVCFGRSDKPMLEMLGELKEDAYIKRGTFSTEIIWGNKSFIYPSINKKDYGVFRAGLFLFGKVRKEAQDFLRKNPTIKLPREERSILYNDDVPNSNLKVCATDLNHAYWRIAYNLGIITFATYKRGLPKKFKNVRLASLSTLGMGRTFRQINGGKISNSTVTFGDDDYLQRVYKLIRFTCFKHMTKVKKMLGDDFIAYKTDCIYYVDTKENRELVNQYFDKNSLTYKQLS